MSMKELYVYLVQLRRETVKLKQAVIFRYGVGE